MTKRVVQHQLEDLSRTKFRLVIPQNWVCRDKDKDYGIDVEVEIFDANDRATGLVFWGQLKATKSEDDSIVKNIDVKIETINYYKSLNIPVLIVRYSAKQDLFYYKWANDVDLFYAKKNAKTLRVTFSESDLWTKGTPSTINDHLRRIQFITQGGVKFPIPVCIDVKDAIIHKMAKGMFLALYRTAISRYPELAVFQSDAENALLKVWLNDDEMEVNLSSASRCTIHSIRDREDDGFAESIAADTLIGCAVNLNIIGQREMMARIVMDDRLKQRFVKKQDVFKMLLPGLLKTSYFGQAIDLVTDVMATNPDNEIEVLTLIAANFETDPEDAEKSKKVEELLKKCLDKYISLNLKSLIGISHYNLGSHYRYRRMLQRSIKHYLQARKFEPAYLNQSYYYHELAGSLFEYEKYHFSSCLYKRKNVILS
jgi:tetratricopeptide (TPR) repeat protein